MSLFAPFRLRFEKDVITHIYRSLKGKGQLNVSVGQQVTPSEIIGSGEVSAGFRLLNLATLLQVSPQDIKNYLKRGVGQKIYKGELLAFKPKKLFQGEKVVTAPTDGVIDFFNAKSGDLRLTFLPKKKDLPAAVYGVVEEVDQPRGHVVIRTQVSKIHGVFGTGKSRDGTLHILNSRDDLVGGSVMSPKWADHILVGGSLIYKDGISKAISAAISGIITGGINAKDYQGMAGGRLTFPKRLDNIIGISLVVCEGFGSISIGDDIFPLLQQYEGRFVFIDGNQSEIILPSFESSSMNTVLKTKLPPNFHLQARRGDLTPSAELRIGQRVRVVGSSFMGEQGKIVSIDKSETVLPSKVRSYLLTIETRRRKIRIPYTNMEILG